MPTLLVLHLEKVVFFVFAQADLDVQLITERLFPLVGHLRADEVVNRGDGAGVVFEKADQVAQRSRRGELPEVHRVLVAHRADELAQVLDAFGAFVAMQVFLVDELLENFVHVGLVQRLTSVNLCVHLFCVLSP